MKKLWVLALAIPFVFAFGGCSGKGGSSSGKSGNVTILYTGNAGARIDPCGCRIPLGGLARRATVMTEMKAQYPEAIILDSGALLYESIRIDPAYEAVHRAKARLVVDEVKRTGIDGANISAMDLSLSPDSLLAFGNGGLPWISANIVWKSNQKLLFPPDMVRNAGELKIGIFGFMDTDTHGVAFFDESSPLTVLDPVATARSEVEKLRKDCDMVVALAYMDVDRVQKLIAEVPGIDVVIVSHTRTHNPSSEHIHFQPIKEGKTLIARCPDGGRVIGRLDLVVANGSTDFVDAGSARDLRPVEVREKQQNDRNVSTFINTFTDLDPGVTGDPGVQAKVDAIMNLWKELEKNAKRNL